MKQGYKTTDSTGKKQTQTKDNNESVPAKTSDISTMENNFCFTSIS